MTYGINNIKELSKESILKEISYYDIFKYYVPNFEHLDVKFCSSLRKDYNPSCSISQLGDKLIYKDWGNGDSYDAWSYVQKLYDYDFWTALCKISIDFNLNLCDKRLPKGQGSPILYGNIASPSDKLALRVKRRSLTTLDLEYWQSYGINMELLKLYKVSPISHYFSIKGNRTRVTAIGKDELAYCYHFGDYNYKIYRPNSVYFKWRGTPGIGHILQGYDELPWTGDLLIVTSSLKDIMCLRALGYDAIAPSSESTKIGEDVLKQLKSRFKRILIYYDNDTQGLISGYYHSIGYSVDYIFNDFDIKEKDISDYFKVYGREESIKLLNKLINAR